MFLGVRGNHVTTFILVDLALRGTATGWCRILVMVLLVPVVCCGPLVRSYLYPPRQGFLIWGLRSSSRLVTSRGRVCSCSAAFRHEVPEFILVPYSPAVWAHAGGPTPLCPSFFTSSVLFYCGEHHPKHFLALYSFVFGVFRVRGVYSFAEGRCLEVVGASGGVLYTRFLDVADPDCRRIAY